MRNEQALNYCVTAG